MIWTEGDKIEIFISGSPASPGFGGKYVIPILLGRALFQCLLRHRINCQLSIDPATIQPKAIVVAPN